MAERMENEVNFNNSRDRDTRLRDAEKEPHQIQRLECTITFVSRMENLEIES